MSKQSSPKRGRPITSKSDAASAKMYDLRKNGSTYVEIANKNVGGFKMSPTGVASRVRGYAERNKLKAV